MTLLLKHRKVVVATTKIDIFKQITTINKTIFHTQLVVVATTKIDIFKQITTNPCETCMLP